MPSFVFGSGPKTHRDLTTRRIVPGPGTYNYNSKEVNQSGVTFTHAKRLHVKYDENPGPGAYRVPTRFADVPKYLIPKQDESFKFV